MRRGGSAAVIDPRRDCEIYLQIASRINARITHIFETHRNEDYVIGSLELANRCGSEIYHGSKMDFAYGNPAKEGDLFRLGGLVLKILETPGHTLESISIMVIDRAVSEDPYLIFCGDALFAGDAGRTDFFGPEKREWASGLLYESIHKKILSAGDGTIICPAHGAGSVCGSDISDHEYSTVGYEKMTNPLLKKDRVEFIERKVKEHHYMPPYFEKMEKLNKSGAPVIHRLPDLEALGNSELKDFILKGAQIIDIRAPTSFGGGHIPGSLSIWREGLAAHIGWYLNYEDPIILIDDFNLDLARISTLFIRLGYDNIHGYLAGGFPTWVQGAEEIGRVNLLGVRDLNHALPDERIFLLDVRDINNRKKFGHISGSHHIYVGELPLHIHEIPKDRHIVVYCDAGKKGSLAASLLLGAGYQDVSNLLGGMSAWMKAGFFVDKK